MASENKKLMMYLQYLKRKLKRKKQELLELEDRVATNVANAIDKQKYFELKGRVQELEDNIDAAEGMMDNGKETNQTQD